MSIETLLCSFIALRKQPLTPSVVVTLNENRATGRRTVLQRWQPGSVNQQEIFIHDYVEEIYLTEGDLYDLTLKQGWQKGAYAYRKPGMKHGPFKSETGCLMFILIIPSNGKDEKKDT